MASFKTARLGEDIHRELTAILRFTVMGSIRGNRLPCTGTGQQTGKDAQRLLVGNDLLHSERSNMDFRERSPHIRISFIGTNHNLTGRSDSKISSRHGYISRQELFAHIFTDGMRLR